MAATVAISGKSGSVTGTGASNVTEWNADLTYELLPATSFDYGGWKENVLGVRGLTGSLTCIGTKPTSGAVATLALNTGGTATLSCAANIGKVGYKVPAEGRVEYTADFESTGVVTIA